MDFTEHFLNISLILGFFGLFAVQKSGKMGNVVKYFFLEGKLHEQDRTYRCNRKGGRPF